MKTKSLYIKNLCCQRCITILKELIVKNEIQILDIQNGVVVVSTDNCELDELYSILKINGFEILDEREEILVNKIKTELLNYFLDNENISLKMTRYLEKKINLSYSYLSKVFSKRESSSIEKYYIKLKIEKVKELIITNQLNLSEIAFMYNYSSVQALSHQFKTLTGVTVKEYKSSLSTYSTYN